MVYPGLFYPGAIYPGSLADGDIAVDGYLIGAGAPIFAENLDPGFAAFRPQDSLNPVGDNRLFGRDFLTPPTWTFDVVVNERTPAEGLAALNAMHSHWQRRSVRLEPGAESALRYRIADRTRIVFGRPRQFAPNLAGVHDGSMTATAEFVCSDTNNYGDTIDEITLNMPYVENPPAPEQQGTITVGGTDPAPPEVIFYGPITNPYAIVDGQLIEMAAILAAGESVTVNTRNTTVLTNTGASLAGALTHNTQKLDEIRITPGQDLPVTFGGFDHTGTARCTVRWRPTYTGF